MMSIQNICLWRPVGFISGAPKDWRKQRLQSWRVYTHTHKECTQYFIYLESRIEVVIWNLLGSISLVDHAECPRKTGGNWDSPGGQRHCNIYFRELIPPRGLWCSKAPFWTLLFIISLGTWPQTPAGRHQSWDAMGHAPSKAGKHYQARCLWTHWTTSCPRTQFQPLGDPWSSPTYQWLTSTSSQPCQGMAQSS